jgi:hypothetical protein
MQYEEGDIVRYAKGSKTLGIEAGEYARVADVDRKQNRITVERNNECEVTYDPRRLQGVALYRETERSLAEGDRVQFTAPSNELHVANRQLGTIAEINDAGDVQIRTDSGRSLHFNIREHPHLDYGYAVTSHSSQGQTTERVLIHVDTEKGEQLVNSRMAYVSISRGQYDAQIYTDNKPDLAYRLSREHSHSTALHSDHVRQDQHLHHAEHKIGPVDESHDMTQEGGIPVQSHGQSASLGQGQGLGE